jgi:hypothetical protein
MVENKVSIPGPTRTDIVIDSIIRLASGGRIHGERSGMPKPGREPGGNYPTAHARMRK